jgi:hypothetical protein
VFELNFDTFIKHYGNPFKNGKYANTLEDSIGILREQSFANEHESFYVKNMFLEEKDPIMFFFTKNSIHSVELTQGKIFIQSLNKREIKNVELIIPDRFNLIMAIHFKNDEKIEFNNEKDTNTSWSTKFRDRIKEVHKLLTND